MEADFTEEKKMQLYLRMLAIWGIIIPLLSINLGCGQRGEKAHTMRGIVELTDGDVAMLTGSHVELALQNDTNQRASGSIGNDGAFTLETIHSGVVLKGVREGIYRARIVLADDDRAALKLAKEAVASRFLDFNKSGWLVRVPSDGTITLAVSKR